MKQKQFYNAQTRNFSRAFIVDKIAKFATEVVGNSYYGTIKSEFNDTKTDLKTRVSFKVSLWVSCLNMSNILYFCNNIEMAECCNNNLFSIFCNNHSYSCGMSLSCSLVLPEGCMGHPFSLLMDFCCLMLDPP